MDSFLTLDSPAGEGQPSPDHVLRPRRGFLADTLGLGLAAGAVALTGSGRTAQAQVAAGINDPALLNFALSLDYLAAEYTTLGVFGVTIEAQGIRTFGLNTGAGNPGPISIKTNPLVEFTTPAIRQFATELAVHEQRHVIFLRNALAAFGIQPAARPALDLLNSFNALAAAAGLPTPFDPFANEVNFLLGAYVLEDLALTALRGAAPLFRNRDVINAAAGLLGVEGYHSTVIRTNLFQLNQGPATDAISNVRRTLGDSVDYGVDNGPLGQGPKNTASIILADANALAPARTARQVLNIVYGAVNANAGLFYPRGLNGPIR